MSILKKIVDWWNDQPLRDLCAATTAAFDRLQIENQQLQFLMSQVPIRTAPKDMHEAQASVTKYAYAHPSVADGILSRAPWSDDGRIAGSPTLWIFTSLMPEYGVIYTPNLMPGIKLSKRVSR